MMKLHFLPIIATMVTHRQEIHYMRDERYTSDATYDLGVFLIAKDAHDAMTTRQSITVTLL